MAAPPLAGICPRAVEHKTPAGGPRSLPADGKARAPGRTALARYRPARLPDPVLAVPAAATLAMTLWGIGASSYWRDEADTVSAVSRSLPQLLRMLGHVDAVHGAYYLLLWPVARMLGTGPLATRLPSALAMAAAAAGVAAIARHLGPRRLAWCAGLVFAVLPSVSVQGHDARPYAMVTAAAVLASYLFIRVLSVARTRLLIGYGASLALAGYLHLFALLLIPAHAVTLAGLARRRRHAAGGEPGALAAIPEATLARRWLAAVAGAMVAVLPLIVFGWRQRAQIGWITGPGWHELRSLVTALAAGTLASAILLGLLAVLGGTGTGPVGAAGWHRGAGAQPAARAGVPAAPAAARRTVAWLAAPWLVVPPAALFGISAFRPVYYFLYVVFCLPAVALLAGNGLAVLGAAGRAVALATLITMAVPAQLTARIPGSGGALQAADQILAMHARPGDAIVYPQSGIPPWYLAYPDGFGRPRDIGLAESGARAARLYGVRVALPVLLRREKGVCRLWMAEAGPAWVPLGAYLNRGLRLRREWQPDTGAMRVWLYQRAAGRCQPGATAPPAVPAGTAAPAPALAPRR